MLDYHGTLYIIRCVCNAVTVYRVWPKQSGIPVVIYYKTLNPARHSCPVFRCLRGLTPYILWYTYKFIIKYTQTHYIYICGHPMRSRRTIKVYYYYYYCRVSCVTNCRYVPGIRSDDRRLLMLLIAIYIYIYVLV